MSVKLDGENIEVGEANSVRSLVIQVKEDLYSTNRILVGIKIDGSLLGQRELEQQLTTDINGKDIELITEPSGELRGNLVGQALSYLTDLQEWHAGVDYPDNGKILSQIEIEKLEQVFEGFVWLSLALDNLANIWEHDPIYNGRTFSKFMEDSKLFLAELEGALEQPEENERLLTGLFFNDLPTWIAEYREVFRDTKDCLGGSYDYD